MTAASKGPRQGQRADLVTTRVPLLTTIPNAETTLLTLSEWRPNLLLRAGIGNARQTEGEGGLPSANALVRVYARSEGGPKTEIARGRLDSLAAYRGSLGSTIPNAGQPVCAARLPAGGSGLEVTWVQDNADAESNVCAVTFELDGWGVESGSPTDDAIPNQAVAQQFFAQIGATAFNVAPSQPPGQAPPHDSYLIDAIFANRTNAAVFVFFGDAIPAGYGYGGGVLQMSPAILVPALATASYTPRRPLRFLSGMQLTASTTPVFGGASAAVDATLTWV